MPTAIVLQRPKTPENVGAVMRLAICYDVDLVCFVGKQRFPVRHPLNTMATERSIPTLHFDDMRALADAMLSQWTPIGVEISAGAVDMPGFVHPRSAMYLFGPEDGSLHPAPLRPRHMVRIPTRRCLNLAHAVGITLYDRALKTVRVDPPALAAIT